MYHMSSTEWSQVKKYGPNTYYGKFIPNLASLIQPLNNLLQHKRKWKWTAACNNAFQQAKEELSSSQVLVHYDPALPLTLAGDASAYGIGAVISHTMPDGTECPIAFASRSLFPSERNYAQLQKEALSLIFGVKKFHQYLYHKTLRWKLPPVLIPFLVRICITPNRDGHARSKARKLWSHSVSEVKNWR